MCILTITTITNSILTTPDWSNSIPTTLASHDPIRTTLDQWNMIQTSPDSYDPIQITPVLVRPDINDTGARGTLGPSKDDTRFVESRYRRPRIQEPRCRRDLTRGTGYGTRGSRYRTHGNQHCHDTDVYGLVVVDTNDLRRVELIVDEYRTRGT